MKKSKIFKRAVLTSSTSVLTLCLITAPVSFDSGTLELETRAAEAKGGGGGDGGHGEGAGDENGGAGGGGGQGGGSAGDNGGGGGPGGENGGGGSGGGEGEGGGGSGGGHGSGGPGGNHADSNGDGSDGGGDQSAGDENGGGSSAFGTIETVKWDGDDVIDAVTSLWDSVFGDKHGEIRLTRKEPAPKTVVTIWAAEKPPTPVATIPKGQDSTQVALVPSFPLEKKMSPLPREERFVIFFDLDSPKLRKSADAVMAAAHAAAHKLGATRISIAGNTDRAGSDGYNNILSDLRARAVAKAMTNRGVSQKVMILSAHGEKKPVVQTADGIVEQKNRRVEIIIER